MPLSTKIQHFVIRKQKIGFLNLLIIVSFLIFLYYASVTQYFGRSPDYENYDRFFNFVKDNTFYDVMNLRFEPLFLISTLIISLFIYSNLAIYTCFVLFCAILKINVILKYTKNNYSIILVLTLYLTRFIPLHELTQLRVACASALLLASAHSFWASRPFWGAFFVGLACGFHLSSIVLLPVLLLPKMERNGALLIGGFVYLIAYGLSGYAVQILGDNVEIVSSYQKYGFGDIESNKFSIEKIIDISFIITLLFFWNNLSAISKKILTVQIIGIAIFYGFLEYQIIAHRMNELFTVFFLILVSDITNNSLYDNIEKNETVNKSFDIEKICYLFVVLCAVYYSYIYYYRGSFFNLL